MKGKKKWLIAALAALGAVLGVVQPEFVPLADALRPLVAVVAG